MPRGYPITPSVNLCTGYLNLRFRIAAKNPANAEQQVRLACRNSFRESKLLERIIPGIEEMLAAGEIQPPKPFEEQVLPAIPNEEKIGDAGHRA